MVFTLTEQSEGQQLLMELQVDQKTQHCCIHVFLYATPEPEGLFQMLYAVRVSND